MQYLFHDRLLEVCSMRAVVAAGDECARKAARGEGGGGRGLVWVGRVVGVDAAIGPSSRNGEASGSGAPRALLCAALLFWGWPRRRPNAPADRGMGEGRPRGESVGMSVVCRR